MQQSNDQEYLKYRGNCKELAEELANKNPNLTIQRGWYDCPIWGEQEHWWCEDENGFVVDPSKKQFPSKGIGTYHKYGGYMKCEYCGKQVAESDIYHVEQHIYCSYTCYGRDVYCE